MISRYALLLSFFIVSASCAMCAGQNDKHLSLCPIQQSPQSYLHRTVEVQASIFIGGASQLEEGKCSFLFAFGDDYQTLGRRFRVKHDAQWVRMQKLLRTPPPSNCSVNARIVRANIKGIVQRIPATGTIPEAEMGLHIVILSVSGVEPVPVKCDPPNTHSSNRRPAFWDLSQLVVGLTYDGNGLSV